MTSAQQRLRRSRRWRRICDGDGQGLGRRSVHGVRGRRFRLGLLVGRLGGIVRGHVLGGRLVGRSEMKLAHDRLKLQLGTKIVLSLLELLDLTLRGVDVKLLQKIKSRLHPAQDLLLVGLIVLIPDLAIKRFGLGLRGGHPLLETESRCVAVDRCLEISLSRLELVQRRLHRGLLGLELAECGVLGLDLALVPHSSLLAGRPDLATHEARELRGGSLLVGVDGRELGLRRGGGDGGALVGVDLLDRRNPRVDALGVLPDQDATDAEDHEGEEYPAQDERPVATGVPPHVAPLLAFCKTGRPIKISPADLKGTGLVRSSIAESIRRRVEIMNIRIAHRLYPS